VLLAPGGRPQGAVEHLVLQIFRDNVGPDPLIAQNWEIWTPEGYTRAGPGEELKFVRE